MKYYRAGSTFGVEESISSLLDREVKVRPITVKSKEGKIVASLADNLTTLCGLLILLNERATALGKRPVIAL